MNRFVVWSVLIVTVFFLVNIEHKIGLVSTRCYDKYINKYAVRFGVDALLVRSIIKKESNLDPGAVSSKGAVGLMQIIPKTASEIALQLNAGSFCLDKLKDPRINIMFGTYYIRKLLDYYNDNLILALAAYNAGMGNVDMWRKKIPDLPFNPSKIPFNETRNYVRSVIFLYKIHKYISQIKV
ncbi:MAG: lytic transglycosylase domain-containing protein [Endomicrobium sp.]|jgi:soluble lytic murein transglycosylase|nr:lytic transglycosylase domain-containing protein [Endomicrobium sp.]